jgi:chromosome segregation ATPase
LEETMTKKTFLPLVAAVVLLPALAAALGYWPSVRALWNRARETVEESKSPEQLVGEIKVHLADMDEQITRHEVQLARVRRQADGVAREVQALEKQRDKHLDVLRQARTLLAEEHDTYEIAGRRCTRAEVHADVLLRCGEVRSLDQRLESRRQVLASMRQAVEDGQKVLAEAKALRGQKEAELATLKTRLDNAQQLAAVQELTRSLRDSPLRGTNAALTRSWEQLRERLDDAEARARPDRAGGLIDWENKSPARDAVREIDALLREAPGGTRAASR